MPYHAHIVGVFLRSALEFNLLLRTLMFEVLVCL